MNPEDVSGLTRFGRMANDHWKQHVQRIKADLSSLVVEVRT